MSLFAGRGSSRKVPVSAKAGLSGAWKTVRRIYVGQGGEWHLVWPTGTADELTPDTEFPNLASSAWSAFPPPSLDQTPGPDTVTVSASNWSAFPPPSLDQTVGPDRVTVSTGNWSPFDIRRATSDRVTVTAGNWSSFPTS